MTAQSNHKNLTRPRAKLGAQIALETKILTEHCDLLIEPRWLIPVQPEGVVLEHYALAVRADKIIAIGPVAELRARFNATTTLVRPEHALIPGLVNAHVHAAMTLLRGLADDYALMPWLNDHMWPAEARWLSPEFVKDGTTLAIAEQFSCGITTMNETYFFPDVAAEVALQYGMRASVGAPIIEFPTAWAPDIDGYFSKAKIFLEQYKNHPMIHATLAPHAPYTVSNTSFEKIAQLSHDYRAVVHCHVHETAQEIQDSQSQYGMRPLARLAQLGLVNSKLAAVHMTQLLPAEIEQLAAAGTSVLHCPESNLKLASGFCPADALVKAGVNLALGTDGCASNNDLDLLGELKTAAMLAKVVANDATALSAPKALTMATLGGARALGLSDSIGSLQVGKQADLTLISFADFDALPVYNPISHVVYSNHRRQVSDVFVAGKARMLAHQLQGFDLPALKANAQAWGQKIWNHKISGTSTCYRNRSDKSKNVK